MQYLIKMIYLNYVILKIYAMKKLVLKSFGSMDGNRLSADEKKQVLGGKMLPPVVGGDGLPPPDYPYPYCICEDGTWETMINGKCRCRSQYW